MKSKETNATAKIKYKLLVISSITKNELKNDFFIQNHLF